MEKRGVIAAGITPPEHEDAPPAQPEKCAQVKELDSDFRKRAADTAQNATK
jgi:hypothetical protein